MNGERRALEPLVGDRLREALARPFRGRPLTRRLAQGCACWPRGYHAQDCAARKARPQ